MSVGWEAKLYRAAAGTADPSTEMLNVRDVKLPLSIGEADISTRNSRFELVDVTLFSVGIEFEMLWDETDADFQAIWTAFTTAAAIAMKALGKASGKGVKSDFKVVKCEAAQDLKGAQIANVTVKPTRGTLAPAFV